MSLHISPGKYGDDEWIFFSVCGNEACKVLEHTVRFDLKAHPYLVWLILTLWGSGDHRSCNILDPLLL